MDTDTVPRLMSPRKAQLVKNFLMDRPGILPMRGPLCEGVTWNLGASIGLCGVWSFNDKLMISRDAPVSPSNTIDYWRAPYRAYTGGAPTTFRANNATAKHIDLVSGVVTDVAIPSVQGVGLKGVRAGGFVYGYQAGYAPGSTTNRSDGGVEATRALIRWDGTATAPFVYALTDTPTCGMDIAFHYQRLFVLGGHIPGPASIERNTLFWSDQLATEGTTPLPSNITAWQDDVSGLVNRIVVGADEASDFGVALAHVGSNLCIFKRHSMWMLYGTSPSNFSVKQVSNEVGCIDPRSVVEYNGGVYFMSERGFMFYDGSRLSNVSVGLTSTLVANALKQTGPQGVDGGYVRASLVGSGYILVATGVMDATTLTLTADTDAWLLHAPSGAWTQLSSGALPAIIAAGRTVNNTWLMTDQKLVKANYLFAPQNAPAGTRGFDSVDSGATKFVIPSRWTTRALELSAPTSKSKLQRIMAEYYWGLANGGWTVTTTTRGATGAASQSAVLAAPSTVATNLPARGTVPVFNETDEVYLDVAATSGAPAAFNDAELHRLLVEYEPTGNTVPV